MIRISDKIVDLSALKSYVADMRKNNKKIVFTNGCFDILHLGHAAYLEKARAYGDCLIVGLNSDASVKKIKGPERPINSEAARAFLIASFMFVDQVSVFSEETPINLIRCIEPDILAKGGDWDLESIIGSDVVMAKGGQVVSIPFEDGYSTTQIIKKIKS